MFFVFYLTLSRLLFSGRTEYQTVEDNKKRGRIERSFTRSPSKRFARRTVGGTTRAVILEEKNSIDGYNNKPSDLNHMGGPLRGDGYDGYTSHSRGASPSKQGPGGGLPGRTALPNSTSYPSSLTRGYDTGGMNGGINHSTNIRATLPNDYKPDYPTATRKARSEHRLDE